MIPVSTSILAKAIVDLEGQEQYQGLMSDTAQCFKQVNSQALAPLHVHISSLSALEESASSSAEGEGGEANSSSPTENSSSQRKPIQTTAEVHNVDSSSQVSSQDCQKDQTVVQMDTNEANGQKRGTASSSDEESSSAGARSENPELQAQRAPVEFRGEVRGGQSVYGRVHSVANATLLTSRAPSTSSLIPSSNYRDSMLDRLSRSQFHDPWS